MRDYILPPLSGLKPRGAVLFLHGVGADGRDLLSMGEAWQPMFPDTLFVSVDAPNAFDMAPLGFGGYQWFSLQDFSVPAMTTGAAAATPALHAYIDGLLSRYELSADALALCGFSQGAMMALYAGTRYKQRLAGIISFAGMLLAPETLPDSLPPIQLVHGDADNVVPCAASVAAADALRRRAAGLDFQQIHSLGHGIDERAMQHGAAALQRFFKNV